MMRRKEGREAVVVVVQRKTEDAKCTTVQVLVHVVGGGVDILLVMYIAFYRVSFHSFLLLFFLFLVFGSVWLFALWTLSNFRC